MIKILHKWLAGLNSVSHLVVLCIINLYLTGLDLLTTYLSTPDLQYEYNPVIIHLQMNWKEIVGFSLLGVTLLFFIFALSILKIDKQPKFKYIFLLGIILFVYHFSYSIFTIANNILSGIYIGKIQLPVLNELAGFYINTFVLNKSFFYEVVFLLHGIFSVFFVKMAFGQKRDRISK